MIFSAQTILLASQHLKGVVRQTPFDYAPNVLKESKAKFFLKLENLQITGSFKPRGATNVLQQLNPEQKLRGVIAPTAGNHGMGLAFAGDQLGIPIHIYLPETADKMKVSFMQQHNAQITFFPDIETARQKALQASTEYDYTFVSAYNNIHMVAGGGTVAVEMLSQVPDLDIVLVCVGGGGLASGVGTFLKTIAPKIQVIGVQTENSPTFAKWHEAKAAVHVPLKNSIAEGLSGFIEPGTLTLPIFLNVIDKVLTVSEEELIRAMNWMFSEYQMLTEPSGVAALAAILAGKLPGIEGKKVGVVVTGSNISEERFLSFVK